ncbi:hypothetical protein N9045_01560 [bacterium]|nr:hypothetical protein [bacterium]
MASIETQLLEMQPGESKTIKQKIVLRYDDDYYIESKEYTLDSAIKFISKNKSKGFPYSSVAFLLVKPPSKILGHFNIKNKQEHKELLEKAKQKQALVYYADVVVKDGRYTASQPWVVDFDSVKELYDPVEEYKPVSGIKAGKPAKYDPSLQIENEEAKVEEEEEDEPIVLVSDKLTCPYCGKEMNSTAGRTLHVKGKHPDMYEEYKKRT